MKKELFVVTELAAGVLLADTMVTTSNTLGFLPVSDTKAKASGMWLVTVPFIDYQSEAGVSEQAVKVEDVLQTANLNAGDELFIPNVGEGTYSNYVLNEGKKWVAAKVVTIDSTGTKNESGVAATVATVARGTAFWVKTSATQINLLGEGVTKDKSVTVYGGNEMNKWSLIGATTCKTEVNLANFKGGKGDIIRLADGTQYFYNASAKVGGWVKSTDLMSKTTDKIPAGVGFWYATKNNINLWD